MLADGEHITARAYLRRPTPRGKPKIALPFEDATNLIDDVPAPGGPRVVYFGATSPERLFVIETRAGWLGPRLENHRLVTLVRDELAVRFSRTEVLIDAPDGETFRWYLDIEETRYSQTQWEFFFYLALGREIRLPKQKRMVLPAFQRWARDELEKLVGPREILAVYSLAIPEGPLVAGDESSPDAVIVGLTSARRMLLLSVRRGRFGKYSRYNRGLHSLKVPELGLRQNAGALEITQPDGHVVILRKATSREMRERGGVWEALEMLELAGPLPD